MPAGPVQAMDRLRRAHALFEGERRERLRA